MTIERDISQVVNRELDKEDSEEILLVFLTIFHQNLYEPIRVVSDPENFILDGNEYQGFEFSISLLSDGDNPPRANLSMQNIDKKIPTSILASTEPIILNIEVIPISEFDEGEFPRIALNDPVKREYRAKYLRLTDVTGNGIQINGTMRSWDYTQESWPALRATEDRFPALFWG